jgi:hypothetical protein
MSQFVYTCTACAWRGITKSGQVGRRGTPPSACGRCGAATLTVSSESKPKVSQVCQDCGAEFIGHAYPAARFCAKCRPNHQGAGAWRSGKRQRRYVWSDEKDAYLRKRYDSRVKGRTYELAKTLGWPRWQIKARARALGLSTPIRRQDFTAQEVTFIEEWTGTRSSHWIADQLKRTETSVILKQKRMGLSRRVRDGYTLRSLEECFGTDHHVIERWVREGKLRIERLGTAREGKQGDIWRVDEQEVIRFVREHPTAFRLDKVDQVWFMDLVVGGGLLRPKETAA